MAFATEDFSDWSKLAEGGEAEVFRARQVSLDRMVAIKRLKLSVIGSAAEIRRFEGEARLYASLSHPSLVQVYDYGRDSKYYYLVMEYLAGADLGRLLDAQDADGLPMQARIHLARQMAEGVDFIHGKGILHRDIKPENFMVDVSGGVKLLDLGLALDRGRFVQSGRKKEALRGTLAYMPPEILKGGALQPVSEYYSLAVVLLELFGGRRLQTGRSTDQLLALIQEGIPENLVPEAFQSLLAPYLEVDPSRRPRALGPLIAGCKAMQGGTIRLGAGEEALKAALLKEKKTWLRALVKASEEAGRWEEAFARLKELLESDPDDEAAQAKLAELGMRLNEAPPGRAFPMRQYAAAGAAILAAGVASFIYIQSRAGAFSRDDMGHDLMEREMTLLSQENDKPAGATQITRPLARPYGVLIVEGLPKEYRVVVNSTRYPGEGEIHLPASRYLLEIQDGGSHSVLRDSVTVGGGEPTVYRYAGRTAGP
jgi:tRNA A-37 threonylcarbamoyl transferase component Bud32